MMKPLVESCKTGKPEYRADIDLRPKIEKFRQKMISMRVNLEVISRGWLDMKNPSKEFLLSVLPSKMDKEFTSAFNAIADIVLSDTPREEKELTIVKIMDDTMNLIIHNHCEAQANR